MAMDKCRACGAQLDANLYLCPRCGKKRPDEEILSRASMAYNADDSDAARKFYNSILAKDSKNAQAYWGLFLLDMGVKDGIINKGPMKIGVPADSYLCMNLTEELYDRIVSNPNYLKAARYADGELKSAIAEFEDWLEERHGELERERTDPRFKARADGLRDYFAPSSETEDDGYGRAKEKSESDEIPSMGLDMGALFIQYLKDTGQLDKRSEDKVTPKKSSHSKKADTITAPQDEKPTKTSVLIQSNEKSTKMPPSASKNKKSSKPPAVAPKRASRVSASQIVATIICCLPTIIELLLVLLIPHIGFLAKNAYISKWGWQALSVPMKVSFISIIVLGFAIQGLGLFKKLNIPLGMATQIITFGLFIMSIYAANNNAASAYTQWGIALFVPISLLVTALRYMSYDMFGFIDDFNFWYYIPIALEVAEYVLFLLVFPLMFGASANLWAFLAITVTTVAAIAVSSFWEDFHWLSAAINLGVAVLLCVIFWLGRLWNSEWLWSGGIITVVILAIGGSWFIHWFIHRNDP